MARHLTSVLIFLLALSLNTPARAELVDRIVAIVNNDIITSSDLSREAAPIFRRITQEAPPGQVEAALIQARDEMLSNLIDKLIVQQRANELGVSISEEEVDKAIAHLLEQNNATPEEFDRSLERMGTNRTNYREVIRSQLLQSKLVSYEIRSKVVITDERIKEYYEKNYTRKKEADTYHILQIGVVWDDDTPAGRLTARNVAENLRLKARNGEDFHQLAKRYSQLPSAADGGDIGLFKKEELAPYMKSSILGLGASQISEVVETPAGYQFFKLLSSEGRAEVQAPFEEVAETIREKLYQEALDMQFQKWVKELKGQAYIKKML